MSLLATSFDTYLALYDDFSRYADMVVMNEQPPIVGATWKTTGAAVPTISSGFLIGTNSASQQLGYLYSIQPNPVTELGCDIVWSGGTEMVPTMTLTISADTETLTLTRMLHFNFGPLGFSIAFGDAVGPGAPLQPVTAGNWTVPMKNDDKTVYRVKMAVRGNGLAVFGPNGEVFGWSDARVSQFAGRLCFLEPGIHYEGNAEGLAAKVKRAWAVADGISDQTSRFANPTAPFATNNDFAALGSYFYYGRVVGALNKMGEVDVGIIRESPGTSFPQVQFGPTNIITSLSDHALAGAVTISTIDYIPAGTSVTIDPGPNQEVVAISSVSSTFPPYQLTIPAPGLASAHANGAIVQCAAAESMRYTVIYDQFNRILQFPLDGGKIVSFGAHLYITTRVGPDSQPMLQLVLDNSTSPGAITSYNGRVRLHQGNTFASGVGNARPAGALQVGDQFYDTNLEKPIWVASVAPNGTAQWKDAAGNVV